MTTSLAYAGAVPPDSATSRMGGTPLAPAGFEWPRCGTCAGAMQFLAQLQLDEARTLAVFQCENDPGGCPSWEPGAGANSAQVFASGNLRPVAVPADGVTTLDGVAGIELAGPVAGDGYFEAMKAWAQDTGRSTEDVLGQWGGEPEWIQGDETPDCTSCERPMAFVAMLNEGRGPDVEANFGTGDAYAFACSGCDQAAFLWQC